MSSTSLAAQRNRWKRRLDGRLKRFSLTTKQVQKIIDWLPHFATNDPWSIILFFISPNIILGEKTPVDIMMSRKKTDQDAFFRAVHTWRHHGAI